MKSWVAPLLRWAGSKRSLVPELSARFCGAAAPGRYIEPFAGSACLFFALRPEQAVLGDLNEELVETYRTLREHPRLLSRAVQAWGTDRGSYYAVRALDPAVLGPIERAARFLYLNRLCFNGVFRTNKAGRFNVPYGTATGAIPSEAHIYRCSVALRSADLRSGDFDATTADVRAGDFVYLDPPYTQDPRSAYGVYGYGSFDGGDLDRVLQTLHRIEEAGATFLFSYAAIDGLSEGLPSSWSLASVEVPGRVAARTLFRTSRTEVLISNADLPVGLSSPV
jgi:DNA adenine methylase